MIDWRQPRLPDGFDFKGAIPFPVKPSPEDGKSLAAELFRAKRGRYTIDVAWLPAYSEDGRLVGRLVEDDNWDNPIDVLTTLDASCAIGWVEYAASGVVARLTEK